MLSIGKLGAGQERYYLDKVAEGAEDYYSGEGEAEGYWLGDGAEFLGLEGKIEGEELIFMLTGRNPASGDSLGLKSAPNREPVPGFDLTFSAPKSVSLAWALGGSPVGGQVSEAHHAAVSEAVSYLERHACWARRGRDGREFLPGTGFIGAGYVHRSSRAGDPQLHTHVLVANATYGPDGRWSRLYHPALYEHAKAAGHIYEAHLRHELTRRLGVEWNPVKNGIADIKSFTDEELAHFSTRRAEILEAAGEGASPRAMQIATLATRRAKERDLTDTSLRDAWRVKGEEVGLTRKAIARDLGHERPGQTVITARQVERTVTAHASHFDRRGAIEAVADNLPHGAPAAEVVKLADAFLASEQVIEIARGPRGATYTTQRIWELEQRALRVAGEMAGAGDRAIAGEIVAGRVLDGRPSLKPDQREMVRRLLCDGEGLVVTIGEAGTGKTYAVSAAASGWAAQATSLQAAAPTWRAANVLRAEGIEATTVAGLLARLDAAEEGGWEGLSSDSVLLVDEAGMVDSASLARLIDRAQEAEAKLVLIGDPAQLGEIEAGGLFAAIAKRSDPIRLHEVIRHRHELDREGAKLIREGEGARALAAYRANDRVTVSPDREELREAMVRDWAESYRRAEDALMIAKRNADARELNVKAREALKAEGRLQGPEIEVGGQRFAKGDQVITRVNDQRNQIYNRERWEVVEVDPRAHAVVLAGIDTHGRQVGVDAGYLRSRNPRDGGPALEHGYAATTYQAQGATVDRAFVMADSSMTRQEFYVAASRSREETYFYATPEVNLARSEIAPSDQREGLAHIAEAAERDGAQLAAHDKALRARLEPLSTTELEGRRAELRSEAGAERANEEARERIAERIAEARWRLERIPERAEAAGNLPRRRRGPERERLQAQADHEAAEIRRGQAELRELPAVAYEARAEAAAADYLLAQREQAARVALRTSPPDYIAKELGERPARYGKAMAWDEAAERIEGYRKREGIGDRDTALGRRPEHDRDRADDWDTQRERLARAQGELGLRRARGWERSLDHGWDLGR